MESIGRTLSDYLTTISNKYGSADAYLWYEGDLLCRKTFSDLNTDSRRIASYLHRHFDPRIHIALLGETSYGWISAYLGIMAGGFVSVPMDAKLDATNLAARLAKADVTVLLISEKFSYLSDTLQKLYPGLKAILRINDLLTLSANEDPAFTAEIDENALAQIMFTSGTTGTGKGAMLSHRNIMHVIQMKERFCNPGDRLLSVLPIHHCFELFYTQLAYLLQGAVVCVNDSLENIIPNMHRFGIHIIITVPMLANRFVAAINKQKNELSPTQLQGLFGGHLKLIGIGGAAIHPDAIQTLHAIGIKVLFGYGLTEGTGGCVVNPSASQKPDSIGIPFVAGLQAKIIDDEICLKGPTTMLGYYNDEDATKAMLIDGWLHTNDLGYMDEDGYIYINGRKNNMIVTTNGENVYPEELEEYIKQIPDVLEAVVYQRDNALAAGIQLADMSREPLVRNEISKRNTQNPSYKAIVKLSFQTNPFPITTSMKVRRKEAIKQLLQQAIPVQNVVADEADKNNVVLCSICDIFAAILNRNTFHPDSNFFDAGGDSLAAIEATAELSKEFPSITPNDLYLNPTPRALYSRFCIQDEHIGTQKISDINAFISVRNPRPRSLGHVLLTGATGYLGNHILHELVEKGYAVTCLIRNSNTFARNSNYYFPGYDFSSVRIVHGDICTENLGLEKEMYQELAQWTDSVIHTAADVRHSGFEEEIYSTNVLGTENMIHFCSAANAKLFHTSTFSVAGFQTERTLTENVLDIGQQISQNIYIKTKYLAEEQVLLARRKGIQTNIMRIGFLTWRKDGLFQINESSNGLVAQLRAFKKLGMYPFELSALTYDFSAVDESAKAFVLLAENSTEDSIWHVMNPNRVSLAQMNIGSAVPKDIFMQQLVQNSADRNVVILSMYLNMMQNNINSMVDTTVTVEKLRTLGFEWSVPESSLPIW